MHEAIFSYYFNLVIYNRIGLIAMRNEQHRYLHLSHQHKCEESEVLDHITRLTKVISCRLVKPSDIMYKQWNPVFSPFCDKHKKLALSGIKWLTLQSYSCLLKKLWAFGVINKKTRWQENSNWYDKQLRQNTNEYKTDVDKWWRRWFVFSVIL